MIYLLILMAALCRLMPHPMNFTPVLAIALFSGAMLPRRIAWLLPIATMLLSDVCLLYILSYPFSRMTLVVYSCFLLSVGLGCLLREKRTWRRTLTVTFAGSLMFYLITNFAVWLGPASPPLRYEHTAAGLARCYIMTLPFFRNAVAGDLLWTTALFGLFDLAQTAARTPRTAAVYKRHNMV